jgi:hypothetical protein
MVYATIAYCLAITGALLWGCEFGEMVKDLVLIILTWFIAKAGTIIDYFYGTSQSSTAKTELLAQAPPPDHHCCRPEEPQG